MNSKKTFGLIVLVLLLTLMLSACSSKQVNLSIDVDSSETSVTAVAGDSVSKVLADNQVEIGENDIVDPALEETIGENSASISVKKSKTVTVVCGKDKKTVELADGTVKDAVEKSGFKVGKADKLNFDETEAVKDGMEIEIKKATTFYVTQNGKKTKYTATATSVGKALSECKIKFDKDDIVEPSADTKLKSKMEIVVKTVEVKEETKTVTIPFSTEKQYSSSMNSGTTTVSRNGSNGQKQVTYKNTYVDGKLTDSETVSEKVVKNPVNKIVVYGTKTTTTKATTQRTTAARKTTAPKTTSPKTTVPKTTAPKTTAPKTTAPKTTKGKTIVSKERVEDCDGSGHGYYIITYSDGSVVYQDF